MSVTRILRVALTKFRVCVCVTTPPKPLNRFAQKLYQQIERLTMIAIGYLNLKYSPPPYLKPRKKHFWGPVMLNQWEIKDSCKAYSKINRKKFVVYGSNDVVQPKDGLFGVRTMSDIIWSKCAPKKPKKGCEWAFSCQTSIILKLTYLRRGSSDFDEIWHSDAV